jgi:hypothetical protein
MRVVVTGAYGYSGQYMAQRLLDAGHEVLALTNSPHRANRFGERVRAFRYNFSRPAELEKLRSARQMGLRMRPLKFPRPSSLRASATTMILRVPLRPSASAHQQFGVESIRLRPPVFTRHRNTRWMDDVGLNVVSPQPAREPEAITSRLIGDDDALDLASGLNASLRQRCSRL